MPLGSALPPVRPEDQERAMMNNRLARGHSVNASDVRLLGQTKHSFAPPRHDDGDHESSIFYDVFPEDPIDCLVLQHLVALSKENQPRLNIKRLRQGEYQIEGRRALLRMDDVNGLVVRPADSKQNKDEKPLAAYFRKVANVSSKPSPYRQTSDPTAATYLAYGNLGRLS